VVAEIVVEDVVPESRLRSTTVVVEIFVLTAALLGGSIVIFVSGSISVLDFIRSLESTLVSRLIKELYLYS
jgi:predicted Co/Zn/Cd cation transporter (cation efflux family)